MFSYQLGAETTGGVSSGLHDSGEMAFGSGMSGTSSDWGVLHPLHPFGASLWTGVACAGLLFVVFRSLAH